MLFYKIRLLNLPKFVFSCHVEAENYSNSFAEKSRFLEISLVEQGTIQAKYSDRTETISPEELMIITEKTVCSTSCVGPQAHTTVGIYADYVSEQFDSCDLKPCDLDGLENEITENDLIVLPHILPLGADYSSVLQRLRTIAARYAGTDPGRIQLCLAGWFELTAFLTKCCLSRIRQEKLVLPASVFRYADRAKQYVQEHYCEQIHAGDIAEQLGISTNYLHSVFKSATGQTLVQYINRLKILLAMQYIKKYNAGAAETAQYIGIEDPLYFCRLFKKYSGLNLQEYRKRNSNMPTK